MTASPTKEKLYSRKYFCSSSVPKAHWSPRTAPATGTVFVWAVPIFTPCFVQQLMSCPQCTRLVVYVINAPICCNSDVVAHFRGPPPKKVSQGSLPQLSLVRFHRLSTWSCTDLHISDALLIIMVVKSSATDLRSDLGSPVTGSVFGSSVCRTARYLTIRE